MEKNKIKKVGKPAKVATKNIAKKDAKKKVDSTLTKKQLKNKPAAKSLTLVVKPKKVQKLEKKTKTKPTLAILPVKIAKGKKASLNEGEKKLLSRLSKKTISDEDDDIETLDQIKKRFEKKAGTEGFIIQDELFDAIEHLDLTDEDSENLL
ncbi:MAG: hypothetical protein RIS53_876, partial [Bacillota bacterium]